MKVLLSILTFSFLTGCAGLHVDNVTQAELANANHGARPDNYKELLAGYLRGSLIDPTSYLIEYERELYKAYYPAPNYWPKSENFGWGVAFRLNAKNRLGGYVGWEHQVAYFRNGKCLNMAPNGLYRLTGNQRHWDFAKPVEWVVPKDTAPE